MRWRSILAGLHSAMVLGTAAAQVAPAPRPTTAEITDNTDLVADTLQVQGGRLTLRGFDTPGAVHVVDAQAIGAAGPMVNLSEALGTVPSIVSLNRNNYAQDLQLSLRGFGARAAFGLRGIRLITDGIPASTPDGQGQSSTVALSSTARIEVLTGPLALIHGNASGGVIQTWTREADPTPQAHLLQVIGSDGLQRSSVQISGRAGDRKQLGLVADFSTFETQGWRAHSAAQRRQFNGVLSWEMAPGTRIRGVVNRFEMPLALDPLGLTAAQLDDPSQAGTGAQERRTRKIVTQEQIGAVLEHRLGTGVQLQGRVFGGQRDNLQYQAGNTWVSLDRRFHGLGLQLQGDLRLDPDFRLRWVAGIEREHAGEQRQGGAAIDGERSGPLTRQEWNASTNDDLFAQLKADLGPALSLTAGWRHSRVELRSRDHWLLDGVDGSGAVRYRAGSPVLGLTWHLRETLNLYLNHGRGFETPTLAEAAYTLAGSSVLGRFNPELAAAASQHLEAGLKWHTASGTRLEAALYRIHTDHEIAVARSVAGRTAFANATSTTRRGLELSGRHPLTPHWRATAALSLIHARYDMAFNRVAAGSALPAVPGRQLFAAVQWAAQGLAGPGERPRPGAELALEVVARSRLWADDANTAAAPGHGLLHLRWRQRWHWGPAQLQALAGIENLADKRFVGSVIVNQANGAYFEPGLPRHWTLGLQVQWGLPGF